MFIKDMKLLKFQDSIYFKSRVVVDACFDVCVDVRAPLVVAIFEPCKGVLL